MFFEGESDRFFSLQNDITAFNAFSSNQAVEMVDQEGPDHVVDQHIALKGFCVSLWFVLRGIVLRVLKPDRTFRGRAACSANFCATRTAGLQIFQFKGNQIVTGVSDLFAARKLSVGIKVLA